MDMKMGTDLPEAHKIDFPDAVSPEENRFGQDPETFETFFFRSVEVPPPDNMPKGSEDQIPRKSNVPHMIDANYTIPGDKTVCDFEFLANRAVLSHDFSRIELNRFSTV